jgi:hypothetical protein
MSDLKIAIARVKRQFTSSNSIPVTRASIFDEDMSIILSALPESDPGDSTWITGDLAVGSEDFLEELKAHSNEICLYGNTNMTRLIGYYEDDDECYYVVRGRYGDKVGLLSCVGGLLSLKKYLPEAVYQGIENTFAQNGSDAEENFQVTINSVGE